MTTNSRVGEGHELVQDGEFKLQLDAVNHRLQGGFDQVDVRVLHGKEANVHRNDDQIYPYELCHDLSCSTVIDRLEESDGRVHVNAGNDEFLQREGGHLQLLDPVESVGVFLVTRRV